MSEHGGCPMGCCTCAPADTRSPNEIRAASVGQEIARRFFATRGQGRNVEVHLRQQELAELLAIAALAVLK